MPGVPTQTVTPAPTMSRRRVALGLSLVFVLLAVSLNQTRPYQGDEPFYLASAVRMVHTGDYLVPVFFDDLRFQKPILAYWATALGYRMFGIDLWSGRVVFLGMSVALLWLTYRTARRLGADQPSAWLAIALLASATLFLEAARVAMTDLPLTLFSWLAVLWFDEALAHPDHRTPRVVAAFAAMGLATASKGPLGLLPLLAVVVVVVLRRPPDAGQAIRALVHPVAWVAWAVLGLSWYLMAWMAHPVDFVRQLQGESGAQFGVGPDSLAGHAGFYLGTLAAYFPLAVVAIVVGVRERRRLTGACDLVVAYAVLACLVPIVGLQAEKARYLFPAFPALAVIAAAMVPAGSLTRQMTRAALGWAIAQMLVIVAVPVVRGEPLRQLVGVWNAQLASEGPLAGYRLRGREAAWALAFSHGRIRLDEEGASFVILDARDIDAFPRHRVIARSEWLDEVDVGADGVSVTKEAFVLLTPEE